MWLLWAAAPKKPFFLLSKWWWERPSEWLASLEKMTDSGIETAERKLVLNGYRQVAEAVFLTETTGIQLPGVETSPIFF